LTAPGRGDYFGRAYSSVFGLRRNRVVNVLVWHVHGSWTTAFVQGRHRYLLPTLPERGPWGGGRPAAWDWPASAVECSPAELADADVDVVVLQRPEEIELAERWLGRRPGRDVPAVFLEHNAPRGGPAASSRHPVADRDDLLLVHVTNFNDLMWDTGAIADDSWAPAGRPVQRRLVLNNSQERRVTLRTTMKAQLAAIGYTPDAITYLALSHYHWDHTANANQFVKSTWLARKIERDAMLPETAPEPPQPSTFADLKNGKTVVIQEDDHDVFGDGTVVLKLAKGHTPGHQVLYVKLAKTGGVVLSGDLYHYPEERTLNRLPTFEFNVDQTRESRAAIEAFLKKTGAQLWIQHDFTAMAKIKKAPAFYE